MNPNTQLNQSISDSSSTEYLAWNRRTLDALDAIIQHCHSNVIITTKIAWLEVTSNGIKTFCWSEDHKLETIGSFVHMDFRVLLVNSSTILYCHWKISSPNQEVIGKISPRQINGLFLANVRSTDG